MRLQLWKPCCVVNLLGQRFGRLVVIARAKPRRPSREAWWQCRCDCGGTAAVRGSDLRRGQTKSCGCLARELASMRTRRHGFDGTPEYAALRLARQRCTNKGDRSYSNYGGRGVKYRLPSDLGEATKLLIAEIGQRPSDGHSLDRIDNDGYYEIGNLRWATRSEQERNKRRRAGAMHGNS